LETPLAVASCSGRTPAAALVGSAVVGSNGELHGVRLSWEAVSSSTKPPLVGPAKKQLDLFNFFLNFVDPKVSPKNLKLEKFTCFVEYICSEIFILIFLPPNVFDSIRYRYFLPHFFSKFWCITFQTKMFKI
jgi:hypothetical protein